MKTEQEALQIQSMCEHFEQILSEAGVVCRMYYNNSNELVVVSTLRQQHIISVAMDSVIAAFRDISRGLSDISREMEW